MLPPGTPTGASFRARWRSTAPSTGVPNKGENLAPAQEVAPGSLNLPTSLDGLTVQVGGIQAPLYAIDPLQINFVVPEGLATGFSTVSVQDASSNVIAAGPIFINPVSPAFFGITPGPNASNPSLEWAWGWTQQGYASNGSDCQSSSGVFYCPVYNTTAGAPVPVGVAQGNTYLVLAANGVRNATDLQATVGGVAVPAQAAPSPSYEGIDQVNIGPLPARLAGAGVVSIVLTAGGLTSNPVAVVIQ
jgi:uncharacterized protein (TIGR03437 family)